MTRISMKKHTHHKELENSCACYLQLFAVEEISVSSTVLERNE